MNPVVKWTGGKRGEIPHLKPHYPPAFSRIVEPFAGGAAVAWDLDGMPAIINDVNQDLIRFYRTLKDPSARQKCHQALAIISARRQHLHAWVSELSEDQVRAFFIGTSEWVARHHVDLTSPPTLPVLDAPFEAMVRKHGKSKVGRIIKIEGARGEEFPLIGLRQHLETALQSAWYEVLRQVYNHQTELDDAWHAAAWWSVRVLCYSSMFRFNKAGLFNVPYGGISYNDRDFGTSFDGLFGSRRVAEMDRFTVESLDFQALFEKYEGFKSSDFVFVDPPYDSTFSQYNVEGDFTAADQTRLRDTLEGSSAKWMIVIKRTEFIERLYAGRDNHCYVFDKNYAVNFRNRHDRGVQHLVATNYPLSLAPTGEPLRPLDQAGPIPKP